MGGRGSYKVFWAKQCIKTPTTTTAWSILKVKSRCRPALVCTGSVDRCWWRCDWTQVIKAECRVNSQHGGSGKRQPKGRTLWRTGDHSKSRGGDGVGGFFCLGCLGTKKKRGQLSSSRHDVSKAPSRFPPFGHVFQSLLSAKCNRSELNLWMINWRGGNKVQIWFNHVRKHTENRRIHGEVSYFQAKESKDRHVVLTLHSLKVQDKNRRGKKTSGSRLFYLIVSQIFSQNGKKKHVSLEHFQTVKGYYTLW